MNAQFDFDKSLKAPQSGKAITGKDGVLTPLITDPSRQFTVNSGN